LVLQLQDIKNCIEKMNISGLVSTTNKGDPRIHTCNIIDAMMMLRYLLAMS
jgi:hypothetical protein